MNDASIRESLARAFRELSPPPARRELPDEDAATRASVAWARGAWDRLQAPVAAPPASLLLRGRRARQSITPHARWRRHAAAAALLAALAITLRLRPEHAPPLTSTVAAPEPPRVTVVDDHIELRSGSVRLLLLPAATDPPL